MILHAVRNIIYYNNLAGAHKPNSLAFIYNREFFKDINNNRGKALGTDLFAFLKSKKVRPQCFQKQKGPSPVLVSLVPVRPSAFLYCVIE